MLLQMHVFLIVLKSPSWWINLFNDLEEKEKETVNVFWILEPKIWTSLYKWNKHITESISLNLKLPVILIVCFDVIKLSGVVFATSNNESLLAFINHKKYDFQPTI